MEQGDIIQVTDVQMMDGYVNPILNVYYFRVATMTVETPLNIYADQLGESFASEYLSVIKDIQSNRIHHTEVRFFNMSFQQEEAVYIYDNPINGGLAFDSVPANLTYSFRLQRSTRLTRSGRKGISGVVDDAIINSRVLNPIFAISVSAVAERLATPWLVEGESADAALLPIIVRVPDNPGTVPTVTNVVSGAVFRGFGTQNSRKAL